MRLSRLWLKAPSREEKHNITLPQSFECSCGVGFLLDLGRRSVIRTVLNVMEGGKDLDKWGAGGGYLYIKEHSERRALKNMHSHGLLRPCFLSFHQSIRTKTGKKNTISEKSVLNGFCWSQTKRGHLKLSGKSRKGIYAFKDGDVDNWWGKAMCPIVAWYFWPMRSRISLVVIHKINL